MNNSVPVVSKIFCSDTPTILMIRRRPIIVNGGGIVVTDLSHNIVFIVDGCGILGSKRELMVKDGEGEPILSISRKVMDHHWKIVTLGHYAVFPSSHSFLVLQLSIGYLLFCFPLNKEARSWRSKKAQIFSLQCFGFQHLFDIHHIKNSPLQGGIVQALSTRNKWHGYSIDYQGKYKLVFSLTDPKSCIATSTPMRIHIEPKRHCPNWDFEIDRSFADRDCRKKQ
jgi:hypothetical protein